jgi:bifunctional DNA-binding transcriptional regulator/antitoxin component of YhaV-PrlF toxin-antitoxin module
MLVLFKYYFISIRNSDKTLVVVKFRRTIRRSGGSAAIAIPPEVLNALSWKIGDLVELYPEEQKLVVKKG